MIAELEKTQRTVFCLFIFHSKIENAKILGEQCNSKPKYVLIIENMVFLCFIFSLINITVILGEAYEIVVLNI